MDSMNFLNKKYMSVHTINSLAHSRNRSSKAFIPSTHFTPMVHNQSQHNSHVTAVPTSSHVNTQMASNHCTIHPHQLIRHLCLDCIQLLCSQCISDHISVHKQNNSFPNIHTLKQVKIDMNIKLQQITGYMFKEKNHPKNMANTVDTIRKESNQKIENLRKDLIDFVDQWINRLRISITNNLGYEEVRLIQQQMYALHEQVNQLINSLGSNTVSVHDIKKAYQIDADRLLKCYKQMMDKYITLSDTMRVDIDLDSSKFIEGLQQSIALKIGGKNKTQIIKVDQNQQSQIIQNPLEQVIAPPQQPIFSMNNRQKHSGQMDCIPLMYNIVSGTDTIRIVDPSNKIQAKLYKLEGLLSYPLNSSSLLSDNMVVISGGMVAQNKKSDIIQVFDYEEGKLVTQSKMNKGRSSHRTIVHGDLIFIIGGFSSDNQECRDIEILTVNGVEISPHKCKWGGPNLCIKTRTNQILKITVSGVEAMNLETLQWHQITNQVPFALSKGMQIASYIQKDNIEIVTIFGDDQYFYQWDFTTKKIIKRESNLSRPVISATTYNNCIYGWVQDVKITLYKLEGENWHITSFK